MAQYKVVAVILNYKTWEETIECVDSLLELNYENHQIVIVENGSENDSYKRLLQNYSGNKVVHLIRSTKNQGFAKGNNLGIRYARKKLGADFVYVANSDTIATNKNLYKEITGAYKKGIGLISPAVLQLDGEYQAPDINCDNIYKKAFISIITVFFDYYFYTLVNWCKDFKQRKLQKLCIRYKENGAEIRLKKLVMYGCAFFLTPDFFDFYDSMYPKTFLYWEEINMIMYIEKAGLRSIVLKQTSIIHKAGKTVDSVFDNRTHRKLKMSLQSGINSITMFFMKQQTIKKRYSDKEHYNLKSEL